MDSAWFQSNTDSKCLDSTMIVKWQDTGEDTELRSWSHESSHGTDGQKMWQTMLQDASNVKRAR